MRIWFDISNISYWQGGVVGVIRAELELAYNFSKISDEILFCRINSSGDAIEAVTREELSWLLKAPTAVDGFLQYQKSYKESKKLPSSSLPGVVDSFYRGNSKLQHVSLAIKFAASLLPKVLSEAVYKFSVILDSSVNRFYKTNDQKLELSHKKMNKDLSHPFLAGDVIFAAGWKDSNKENLYERIKKRLKHNLHLSYLIYDTILINENTKHLYDQEAEISFTRYFDWIAKNCDVIFYGGNTAMFDSQQIQVKKGLPIPKGIPVRFGDLPNPNLQSLSETEVIQLFKKLDITKNKYLLCVGSIEPRKNHSILYKAYRELMDYPEKYNFDSAQLLKLVFVGGIYGSDDLVYNFKNDPRFNNLVVFVKPTDEELDSLYKYCTFTLMPTLYEGWNLTMPESLSYGKFCISSDVPPMVEIGRDLVDYADPYNPTQWAKLISKYCTNRSLLNEREAHICKHWTNYSWFDCAKFIFDHLNNENFQVINRTPSLWFDVTLINNLYSRLDGIPRVELSMAWELYHKNNLNLHFFEFKVDGDDGEFIEIYPEMIPWLNKSKKEYVDFYHIHQSYKKALYEVPSRGVSLNGNGNEKFLALTHLKNAEPSRKRRLRIMLLHLLGIFPISILEKIYTIYAKYMKKDIKEIVPTHERASLETMNKEKYDSLIHSVVDYPFNKGDVVISMGLDWQSKYLQSINIVKEELPISSVYFVHDMIPLLEPNFYHKDIPELYEKFFYWVCKTSDQIFFGGNTALEDGKRVQKELNIECKSSMSSLRLGAEFDISEITPSSKDENILNLLGIDRPFILSVGTLQIRKNHEVIYRALLALLEETPSEQQDSLPLIVFAGGQGWLAEQLIKEMKADTRIKNHLLLLKPNDDELRVLYRNCLFTILPSLYEGAALPISESFAYGKFCLVSNVPPLRESGGLFCDYVEPRDPKAWKEKIKYYINNPKILKEKEELLQTKKAFVSWSECADELLGKLPHFRREVI